MIFRIPGNSTGNKATSLTARSKQLLRAVSAAHRGAIVNARATCSKYKVIKKEQQSITGGDSNGRDGVISIGKTQ